MMELCILIPCFNEETKLLVDGYRSFLKAKPNCGVVFSNDGSTDGTLSILKKLEQEFPNQVFVYSQDENKGKANAIHEGFKFAYQNLVFEKIAYIDADLAVSLEECFEMRNLLSDKTQFVFGSRILRVGSNIERKFYRFFIGRIIATLISRVLRLKVYDTQCGCKLFTFESGKVVLDEGFISKWLFDVEIFFRLFKVYGKDKAVESMLEWPLKEWIDRGESKVKFSYGFIVFSDLIKIQRKYQRYR